MNIRENCFWKRKRVMSVLFGVLLLLMSIFSACQKKQQNTAISDADTWEKPSISASHIPATPNTGNPFYDFMPEGLSDGERYTRGLGLLSNKSFGYYGDEDEWFIYNNRLPALVDTASLIPRAALAPLYELDNIIYIDVQVPPASIALEKETEEDFFGVSIETLKNMSPTIDFSRLQGMTQLLDAVNVFYTPESEDFYQWLYPEIKGLDALNAGEIIFVVPKGEKNDFLQVGDKAGMVYADSDLPFTEAKENPSSIDVNMVEVTIAQIVEIDFPKADDGGVLPQILIPTQTLELYPYYDAISYVTIYTHPKITEAEQAALDKAVDKIVETTSAEYPPR